LIRRPAVLALPRRILREAAVVVWPPTPRRRAERVVHPVQAVETLPVLGQLALQALKRFRIRAQPVIEVEEHRRTFGRGIQQVAELAHDVRADDITLVRGEQPFVGALAANTLKWLNQKSTINSLSCRSL